MKFKRKSHRLNRGRNGLFYTVTAVVAVTVTFALCSFHDSRWFFDWSGVRPHIKDSALQLEWMSFGGWNDHARKRYAKRDRLLKAANETELLRLAQYPNGSIKATAYRGLLGKTRDVDLIFNLLMNALDDTTTHVGISHGCTGDYELTGLFIVEYLAWFSCVDYGLTPPPPPPPSPLPPFSEKQIELLRDKWCQLKSKQDYYLRKQQYLQTTFL